MADNQLPGITHQGNDYPVAITQVETAIPAFIGYAEKGPNEPTRINSMQAYRNVFGGPNPAEIGEFQIDEDGGITAPEILKTPIFRMYYMLEMFFANGGEDCFIIAVGQYDDSPCNEAMETGLELLNEQDFPTLIVLPDAGSFKNPEEPTELYKKALMQCADRRDRFLICDVEQTDEKIDVISKSAEEFRTKIGMNNLEFGAAYFPYLKTSLTHIYDEQDIKVKLNNKVLVLRHKAQFFATAENSDEVKAKSLYHKDNGRYRVIYQEIKNIIKSVKLELPPSAAVAGAYIQIDNTRGVWQAPANISLNKVITPTLKITNKDQEGLNVTPSGKSINAIREFKEEGVLIWGARTLDGNSNEWRYIPVRRLFIMVENSIENALKKVVYEPNTADTWVKIEAMINNFLISLWRSGGLSGAKPEQAFYVRLGLNQTMTVSDILEGKMIVEIGLAPIRPAEFVILRLSVDMEE